MIKALIFDFDGLILDTESTFFQAWQEIFQSYGLSLSMQEWAGFIGHSADPEEPYVILENHLKKSIDRESIRAKRILREKELLVSQKALPGVEPLIHEAKCSDLKVAIASSSDRYWITKYLTQLDLIHYIDVLKCAEDVMHTKPKPDLYNSVLEALGITPDEAIALEDSIHGVKAAKTAGIFCVAVPNRITKYVHIEQADIVLDSLLGISLKDLQAMVEEGRLLSASGTP
jgi:HAD superfamily hydrolase (TIGR01509 family)